MSMSMEAGSSGSFDADAVGPSGTQGAGSTKRLSRTPAKGKTTSDPSSSGGTRFQCPKCPKNFSRIENLTRHQANHDDVGKFACVVCRKRFTRSDLLNRHRRIHDSQAESSKAISHVTPSEQGSVSPPNADPRLDNLIQRDSRGSLSSQEGSGSLSTHSPAASYHQQVHQPHGYYSNQNLPAQQGYQSILTSAPNPSIIQHGSAHPQGLSSLVEAALAPQQSFIPIDNINPSLWDGFMLFGDNTNTYMGSYDGDISWTLNSFHSESSPSYSLDTDMNTFDDFPLNPYPYPPLQYNHHANPIDVEDAEDEDTNDWPDKVSGPTTPQNRAPRIVPRHLIPVFWQPVIEEARASGLSAATIRPMQQINDGLRQVLLGTLNGSNYGRNEISRPEISDAIFPPSEALDFFLRLYIQYIQPRFPVLHLPTFDMYICPPLLLIAMMCLGSSHSGSDRGRFSRLFHDHLRIAVIRMQEVDPKYLRSVDNILTYFLLCLAGTWSGSKQAYEFAEGGRGILITACRRARLLDCRPSSRVDITQFQRPGMGPFDAVWLAWVETEKRKRLGLSVYIFDCQYPALFNNQPYVSKAETTNCVFPCPEEFWEASSAQTWKMLVGPNEMPPATYYLHALNCCLLRKWVKPAPPIVKTGEFGKLVLIYAIQTHIFEWRQATSMLNPTGLMGTFGNSAHDMGNGLRERRKWLVDGLDSWGECYQGPGTSAAASLIHLLAYIALDVSLSDMHLVAGRSNNTNDGNFAEENLKHWANSEIAKSTMSHVRKMLDLCHHCINTDLVADSSYEVAVCLFTGGIVCWAYAKLNLNAPRQDCIDQVRRASVALQEMGCWRMCSMFGRILNNFDIPKRA